MVSVRRKLACDDFGGVDLLPCLFLVAAIALALLPFLFSLLLFSFKKKLAILALFVSILIVVSAGGWFYYTTTTPHLNHHQYTLVIGTDRNGEYTLVLPCLDNRKLQSELKIVSGSGTIGFTNVTDRLVYNSIRALKVTGNGSMRIEGNVEDDSWSDMSLETDPSHFHWVYCNKTYSSQNISISIAASTFGGDSGISWETRSYLGDVDYIYVENGWQTIRFSD